MVYTKYSTYINIFVTFSMQNNNLIFLILFNYNYIRSGFLKKILTNLNSKVYLFSAWFKV